MKRISLVLALLVSTSVPLSAYATGSSHHNGGTDIDNISNSSAAAQNNTIVGVGVGVDTTVSNDYDPTNTNINNVDVSPNQTTNVLVGPDHNHNLNVNANDQDQQQQQGQQQGQFQGQYQGIDNSGNSNVTIEDVGGNANSNSNSYSNSYSEGGEGGNSLSNSSVDITFEKPDRHIPGYIYNPATVLNAPVGPQVTIPQIAGVEIYEELKRVFKPQLHKAKTVGPFVGDGEVTVECVLYDTTLLSKSVVESSMPDDCELFPEDYSFEECSADAFAFEGVTSHTTFDYQPTGIQNVRWAGVCNVNASDSENRTQSIESVEVAAMKVTDDVLGNASKILVLSPKGTYVAATGYISGGYNLGGSLSGSKVATGLLQMAGGINAAESKTVPVLSEQGMKIYLFVPDQNGVAVDFGAYYGDNATAEAPKVAPEKPVVEKKEPQRKVQKKGSKDSFFAPREQYTVYDCVDCARYKEVK